ncbi:hypothetical protein AJ79_00470 [Helicocarpus griseus UAMH5409]|uniref:F-box domain-containing protein n=1 Tax=Helicocarpus griseus UAMH5409 TaxID=1447875 RepID=A0A2B7YC11_9EURO|nr:hypothetical protein AJ79_00470 [Helicocarpus griseus UAMH5409]
MNGYPTTTNLLWSSRGRPVIRKNRLGKSKNFKPLFSPLLDSLRLLPPELLFQIFGDLDFRTLTRLRCTSRAYKAAVESFPAYRHLMENAPVTLEALSISDILTHHSAEALSRALWSEQCVSCNNPGPFLFIPTAERCCHACISQKDGFS